MGGILFGESFTCPVDKVFSLYYNLNNMKSQAPDGATVRVFFSFHIPADVGECLLSAVNPDLPIQLYPSKNLHLTLKFIGDVDEAGLQKIIQLADESAKRAPPLSFSFKRFYIADGRLRLGAEPNPDLSRLFNYITDGLESAGIGTEQPKNYTPHITLGRVSEPFKTDDMLLSAECAGLSVEEFGLYKSKPGEEGIGEYELIKPFVFLAKEAGHQKYQKIILPTRPQPDTLTAIFILKKFGESRFPGIKEAEIGFWQTVPEGETEESLDRKGILLMDLGGGRFDHHAKKPQTTASDLIAEYLGIVYDPSLSKLLEYARRDDFFGKGTVSDDPLDRAFGLSALIANLNKGLVKNPAKVVDVVMPILIAHHDEEVRRTVELPKEFEDKLKSGQAEVFEVKQRKKKLKAVIVDSESGSLAGYLRSQQGGRFDIVAQRLPSGHVNILTRPTKRIDLRSLVALLRMSEAESSGSDLKMNVRDLARFGRIREVPEWYYDPATNSIQNGGLLPKDISPTKILKEKFRKIIELGISEEMWDPRL